MSKTAPLSLVVLMLTLLAGCGGTANPPTPPTPPAPGPLSAANVNLIFVVSEDVAYHASGDINLTTANLTNQGLQRSLQMAGFLRQSVLGGKNVTGLYAIEPMTHLQTGNRYPDLVALETIQQFAMLNKLSLTYENKSVIGNSYPILASYSDYVPEGVAPPVYSCPACQGLDFSDQGGDNESLVSSIVTTGTPGFYVFSAPWDTVSSLLATTNERQGYKLTVPASYAGPNYIYAIAITPSGNASLVTYNSNLNPPRNYPVLSPPPVLSATCNGQPSFTIKVTGGSYGAVIPAGTNINETVYFIRHAEAHPQEWWDDGNYIARGHWRALDLPNALRDKIQPTQVYSIDPAVTQPSSEGSVPSSYVRPALTAEPYAIANNLPFNLAASVAVFAQNPPQLSTAASNYFFTGGTFSNQTLLVAWEHDHIPPTVNALLASYHSDAAPAPKWPSSDYDTIWTVTLDANGNLTVDNAICEGIASAELPNTPPRF